MSTLQRHIYMQTPKVNFISDDPFKKHQSPALFLHNDILLQ